MQALNYRVRKDRHDRLREALQPVDYGDQCRPLRDLVQDRLGDRRHQVRREISTYQGRILPLLQNRGKIWFLQFPMG
jgi:hypothetical protein